MNGRPLQRLPPDVFTRRAEAGVRTGGGPLFFTVQAGAFSVTPMATSGAGPTDATLTYWATLPPLAEPANPTNAVLTRWPQLYLYGALIEAYWFINQFTSSADALQRFVDEINIINTADSAAKWGAAPAAQAG